MMFKKLLLLMAVTLSILIPGAANATVTLGSSSSLSWSSSLYSDNNGNINIGFDAMFGTAPAPYSNSYGPTPTGGSANGILTYSADFASGEISSDVDGSAGSKSAMGHVLLDNFSFSMLDILSITGDLESKSTATGDFGTMGAATLTDFQDGVITVLGNEISAGFGEIYNADGLVITMHNASLNTGDPFSEVSASVFFIQFTNFAYGGDVFNGSITLAPTTANLRAVPEPASMLVLGGLGLATVLRRRRKN